jgi:hypothetical protein
MGLFARETVPGSSAHWFDSLPLTIRFVVTVTSAHFFLKHLSDEARYLCTLFCGPFASPVSNLLGERDGDVLQHEFNLTREHELRVDV